MPSPVEIVRAFRSMQVVVVGDAMLDSYLEGSAARLCSEGPVPVVRAQAGQNVPGGAANTATNLRALGAVVRFVGIIGDDHTGALLREALRAAGVGDDWLVVDDTARTLHKHRIIADGQYVVRVDDGDTARCSPAGRARLIANLDSAFAGCDALVISDYGYGAVPDDLIERLRELRGSRHVPLVIDSKQLGRFRTAGATVITPNHLEARLVVEGGQSHEHGEPGPAGVSELGRRLLEIVDSEYAAVTMAAHGVVLVGRDGAATHIPAHPVAKAFDVGAGDSFAAALALALAAGAEQVEAARIASDAAGIAVAREHTAVVQHQELLQRVSLRSITHDSTTGDPAARLAEKLLVDRLGGRTIVFTNGVFDILHAGHVHLLRQSRALGDVLVVGVNSDRGAARLKGKGRPINHERDRLALIAALDAVDHAVLFDEDTPAELIRLLRPHIHAKGGDYAGVTLPEEQAVLEAGGRVAILPLAGTLSTSALIDRIVALAASSGAEAVHD